VFEVAQTGQAASLENAWRLLLLHACSAQTTELRTVPLRTQEGSMPEQAVFEQEGRSRNTWQA